MSWFSKWIEPQSGSGRAWYARLLEDPLWKAKAHKIKERDNWTCQKGFEIENPLHVHHKGYCPGRKPWEYPDHVLITLCNVCHPCVHDFDQLPQNSPFFLRSPAELVCVACGAPITVEQASGRNGKHEPICESCCLMMEEGRVPR